MPNLSPILLISSSWYKSQGINWWCVIYPPLCLIDDKDNTEYTTLAQEIINKYNM